MIYVLLFWLAVPPPVEYENTNVGGVVVNITTEHATITYNYPEHCPPTKWIDCTRHTAMLDELHKQVAELQASLMGMVVKRDLPLRRFQVSQRIGWWL